MTLVMDDLWRMPHTQPTNGRHLLQLIEIQSRLYYLVILLAEIEHYFKRKTAMRFKWEIWQVLGKEKEWAFRVITLGSPEKLNERTTFKFRCEKNKQKERE